MLFTEELTDLIVIDVKGFEGIEFLTKCAQHLAELDFSNVFPFICLFTYLFIY